MRRAGQPRTDEGNSSTAGYEKTELVPRTERPKSSLEALIWRLQSPVLPDNAHTTSPNTRQETNHDRPKYQAFTALDPFFAIVQQGLGGMVDGDHYFDTIADNAIFEYRYHFPGYPRRIDSRQALMALYAGYGSNILLHGADGLVVHRSQDPRVVILEYEVHGKVIRTGASYDNRFISVVTIEDRKIVHWRDYMDSLAAMTALRDRKSVV